MINFYVINLPDRIDRRKNLQDHFSQFPMINLIFIEAIRDVQGFIGCFKSHQKCIQIAKDQELPYIIVIEDDCITVNHLFQEKLIKILSFLNEFSDWDIFLGGGTTQYKNIIKSVQKFSDFSIYSILHSYDSHFVIYRNTMYDIFLQADPTKIPIDHYWPNEIQNQVIDCRMLLSIPFIAIQCSSYSDITNSFINNDRFQIVDHRLIKRLNVNPK